MKDTEMTATNDSPRVYVGTYKKYNSGSIEGDWLDLEDYATKEEFLEACAELHKDEGDPEFMFQDFENVPRSFANEHGIDDRLWEWLELDEDDREIWGAYDEHVGGGSDFITARDAYLGTWDSLEAYVENYWEDCGYKGDDSWWHPSNYVDWERMARDLEMSGDVFTVDADDGEVMVFSSH